MREPEDVYSRASALLSRFLDPVPQDDYGELVASLKPRDADYAQVFTAPAAERARAYYERVYQELVPPLPKPGQRHLLVVTATAAELASGHPRAQAFPGGYKQIGALLVPERLWTCWRYVAPGEPVGMAYDGLVAIDDRFVWLPKPWRALPAESAPGLPLQTD